MGTVPALSSRTVKRMCARTISNLKINTGESLARAGRWSKRTLTPEYQIHKVGVSKFTPGTQAGLDEGRYSIFIALCPLALDGTCRLLLRLIC